MLNQILSKISKKNNNQPSEPVVQFQPIELTINDKYNWLVENLRHPQIMIQYGHQMTLFDNEPEIIDEFKVQFDYQGEMWVDGYWVGLPLVEEVELLFNVFTN